MDKHLRAPRGALYRTLRDCSLHGRVLASAELGNGPGVEPLQRCTRKRRNRPGISFNEKHTQAQARAEHLLVAFRNQPESRAADLAQWRPE